MKLKVIGGIIENTQYAPTNTSSVEVVDDQVIVTYKSHKDGPLVEMVSFMTNPLPRSVTSLHGTVIDIRYIGGYIILYGPYRLDWTKIATEPAATEPTAAKAEAEAAAANAKAIKEFKAARLARAEAAAAEPAAAEPAAAEVVLCREPAAAEPAAASSSRHPERNHHQRLGLQRSSSDTGSKMNGNLTMITPTVIRS